MTVTDDALARDERAQLMHAYTTALESFARMTTQTEDGSAPATFEGAANRVLALRDRYRLALRPSTMSRSPITGAVFTHSFDPFGLDGLWWDYEHDARPVDHTPADFFALTGAVRITGEVPYTPFVCCPGPEVPYVIPSLLEHPEIVAVLSQLSVGAFPAYAITYFASPVPRSLERWNTWGTDHYVVEDENGEQATASRFEDVAQLDFEIASWIHAGMLKWIAPGDPEWTLREGVDGCPYLGLSGSRQLVTLQYGRAWT